MIAQASQALLRASDNRTSSAVLRGRMRRDPHGPLLPEHLILEPLLGVKGRVPRT